MYKKRIINVVAVANIDIGVKVIIFFIFINIEFKEVFYYLGIGSLCAL